MKTEIGKESKPKPKPKTKPKTKSGIVVKEEKNFLEKTPLSSKKFIAYMIAEIGWKALLIILLFNVEMSLISCALMMSIVIISGFVQVGYILGQAAVDKYVKVARVSGNLLKPSADQVEDDNDDNDDEHEPSQDKKPVDG